MRITADTNVLVRAIVEDDELQSPIAQRVLSEAELVAVAIPALCELVWVLRRAYRLTNRDVAEALRRLIGARNVVVDRQAAEAGLAMLDAGGDFADGAIAHEGRWLGAEVFLSFDRDAVNLMPGAARSPE